MAHIEPWDRPDGGGRVLRRVFWAYLDKLTGTALGSVGLAYVACALSGSGQRAAPSAW